MAKKRGRPRKSEVIDDSVEVVEDAPIVEDAVEPIEETGGEMQDIIGNFNPLQESVVEREYATPEIADGNIEDIAEPMFKPPSYDDIIAEEEQSRLDAQAEIEAQGGGFDGVSKAFDKIPSNPALNDVDRKDKKVACESLVDTILDGYEGLHAVAQQFLQVNEDELNRMQIEGKIDLAEFVPLADGSVINVGTFVNSYNSQCVEALEFDPEFKEKVKPAMVRVFMKRGWGLSDEQYLMYMFGKDILMKTTMVFQLKSTMNKSLQMFEDAYKQKYSYEQTQVEPQAEAPTPRPTPTPSSEALEDLDEDVENEINEILVEDDEDNINEMQEVDVADLDDVDEDMEIEVSTNKMSMPEKSPLAQTPPSLDERPSNVKIKKKRK